MDVVMLRFGELFLKSEPVQRHYIRLLLGNLKNALEAQGLEYSIDPHRGRILISGEDLDAIAETASRLFGIVGVSIATLTAPEREEIEEVAFRKGVANLRPGMRFAVRARRSGIKEYTSQELAASIGSRIYDTVGGLTVDLTSPEYAVTAEARPWGGLVYDSRTDGPGGLPLGTQGRVISLLSAGIDSPVASWLMMRRGCNITHLHLAGGHYAGKDIPEGVSEHMKVLSTWCMGQNLRLLVISMEPFYEELIEKAALKNRCIICKRFMLRVAAELARKEKALAIVTGDSIGQVASQTLVNIGVTEEVLTPGLPVIRPLITYDKQETTNIARRIGTFRENAGDLGCTVVPKHPAIAASTAEIHEDEEKMDIEGLLKKVLATAKIYKALNGEITQR